jgi:hypothetical protein
MNQSDHEWHDVMEKLGALTPTAVDAPPPAAQTLAHIRRRLPIEEKVGWRARLVAFITPSPTRRYAFTLTALAIVFALAFSFPAVRAAASDFLALFRVQEFTAVAISPEQVALLQQVAEAGLTPGELHITRPPADPLSATSLTEAASLAGFRPRSLAALGAPTAITVSGGGSGYLVVDLAGARAILAATGVDPLLLPDSLAGAQVSITAFVGVDQTWDNGVWLMQTGSPAVEYPADVDPLVLGEAFLQVLGLSSDEARRLAQQIDWTGTLLLPVPQNVASFEEVTIGNATGLALTSLDGQNTMLLWQQDGMVYLLGGPRPTQELVNLASALQ